MNTQEADRVDPTTEVKEGKVKEIVALKAKKGESQGRTGSDGNQWAEDNLAEPIGRVKAEGRQCDGRKDEK